MFRIGDDASDGVISSASDVLEVLLVRQAGKESVFFFNEHSRLRQRAYADDSPFEAPPDPPPFLSPSPLLFSSCVSSDDLDSGSLSRRFRTRSDREEGP